MKPTCVMIATLLGVMPMAGQARAQQLDVGWGVGLATGFERSELLAEGFARRARTRLVVPLDLRVDEAPNEGLGFVAFAEIEPRVSLGGNLRYMRWLGRSFVGFVGATGVVAPHTLAGVEVGCQVHIPLGRRTSIYLEPSFAAIPLGTDLPDDRLLIWGLLALGFHAN